ncbi:MAG: zinc ribbon domain-containing protein, partial [Bacteroidota bacterium]
MKNCPHCQTRLPLSARFCSNCGAPQAMGITAGDASSTFNWEENESAQAFSRFKKRLEERVKTEQDPKRINDFIDRLYQDDYRETVDRRLKQ